jgi:hypothetical protein
MSSIWKQPDEQALQRIGRRALHSGHFGRPVSAIPKGGNVDFINEIRLTVAGTAGGTVVDLAKLGLSCQAVGAVGDDEKADFVIDRMAHFGIDCLHMARLDGVETSATILNVRPNGERPASPLSLMPSMMASPAVPRSERPGSPISNGRSTALLRRAAKYFAGRSISRLAYSAASRQRRQSRSVPVHRGFLQPKGPPRVSWQHQPRRLRKTVRWIFLNRPLNRGKTIVPETDLERRFFISVPQVRTY